MTQLRVEEAIKKDSEDKQKDELDPFTRRKCIPTLVSKVFLAVKDFCSLNLWDFCFYLNWIPGEERRSN